MDFDLDGRDFRVIAEGDDAVATELTIVEAVVALDLARKQGKRHAAIVDDTTGAVVDDAAAREWVREHASDAAPSHVEELAVTSRNEAVIPCPQCQDDSGQPVGEVLVQLPSGTWVREACSVCRGRRVLDAEGQARYHMARVNE